MVTLLFVSILIVACSKDTPQKEDEAIVMKKSVADSKGLIHDWIFNVYNPDMNSSITFDVEDMTTDEIFSRTGGQVFNILCEVPGLENRAVFIRANKVYDLGRINLYGAHKIKDLMVTDLDNNNEYELCYALVHGSGISRTNIICYINNGSENFMYTGSELFNNYTLVKESYHKVRVDEIKNNTATPIGYLSLSNGNLTIVP